MELVPDGESEAGPGPNTHLQISTTNNTVNRTPRPSIASTMQSVFGSGCVFNGNIIVNVSGQNEQ